MEMNVGSTLREFYVECAGGGPGRVRGKRGELSLRLSEQPACAVAKRTKLATGLDNQKGIGRNCMTSGIATSATVDRESHQNFSLSITDRAWASFHRLT
jgi:hypothetical protein